MEDHQKNHGVIGGIKRLRKGEGGGMDKKSKEEEGVHDIEDGEKSEGLR